MQWLNWIELSATNGEFEGALAATPSNIALNSFTSASSVYSSSYSVDKAFDGDPNTRWASTERTPWVEVDFGKDVFVNGVSMADYQDRIRSYEVQVYEEGMWKTVFVGGNPVDNEIVHFSTVIGSKFRLQVLTSANNPSIFNLELYGVADLSTAIALNPGSITLEWPNMPGAIYSVLRSRYLETDPFTETVESGIPAFTETNSITIDRQDDPAAFFRVVGELSD